MTERLPLGEKTPRSVVIFNVIPVKTGIRIPLNPNLLRRCRIEDSGFRIFNVIPVKTGIRMILELRTYFGDAELRIRASAYSPSFRWKPESRYPTNPEPRTYFRAAELWDSGSRPE